MSPRSKPQRLQTPYSRNGPAAPDSGGSSESTLADSPNSTMADSLFTKSPRSNFARRPPAHRSRFPPPSIFQRAYLKGFLHRPSDIIFLIRALMTLVWLLFRLHFIELPYLILTRFKHSTKQHPVAWAWWVSVFFTIIRSVGPTVRSLGQLRFVGLVMEKLISLQFIVDRRSTVKITRGVQFRVKLDVLLRPERATLSGLRAELRKRGASDDPLNPNQMYFESFHPRPTEESIQMSIPPLANIPEEVGALDDDGTFVIEGEWIEALEDPKRPDPRPHRKTVILYFHGGGHLFCSPRTHTHYLAGLAKEVGPGTRIFSVDYRMGPEHPFPAAIHDAFAAYLYLTEPKHAALILGENSAPHELAVDPRDVVIAGDSAGGNLSAALLTYMERYVQPSTMPPFVLPHSMVLLSPWTEITSAMPSAYSSDWYCYCPGPIGTPYTDKQAYITLKQPNYASAYLCGDSQLVLNPRNALGVDRRWEWYRHLAQHPLVSPSFSQEGYMRGLPNTLVQTATFDRLIDDSRLMAHRLGVDNPDQIIRIELYKDMVHVHQILQLLFNSSRVAIRNMARFIERCEYVRDEKERRQQQRDARSSAALLRKVSTRDGPQEQRDLEKEEYVPAFMRIGMVTETSLDDGVEWVVVEQNGKESAEEDGWPMAALKRSLPTPSPIIQKK